MALFSFHLFPVLFLSRLVWKSKLNFTPRFDTQCVASSCDEHAIVTSRAVKGVIAPVCFFPPLKLCTNSYYNLLCVSNGIAARELSCYFTEHLQAQLTRGQCRTLLQLSDGVMDCFCFVFCFIVKGGDKQTIK